MFSFSPLRFVIKQLKCLKQLSVTFYECIQSTSNKEHCYTKQRNRGKMPEPTFWFADSWASLSNILCQRNLWHRGVFKQATRFTPLTWQHTALHDIDRWVFVQSHRQQYLHADHTQHAWHWQLVQSHRQQYFHEEDLKTHPWQVASHTANNSLDF